MIVGIAVRIVGKTRMMILGNKGEIIMKAKKEFIDLLSKYNGMILEEKLILRQPAECLRFYQGLSNETICAFDEDNNHTLYYLDSLNGIEFAESFKSEGHILHVYEEFLN